MRALRFQRITRFLSRDLAIDFGMSNTRVYAKGSGVVANEPSIMAVRGRSAKAIAVGKDAHEVLRHHPGIVKIARPLTEGTLTELEPAQAMFRHCIRRAHFGLGSFSPRVVIGKHSHMTQVEMHAMEEAAYGAGASEVYLMDEAVAAAIGMNLELNIPYGQMIVDIGGGRSNIGLISAGSTVHSRSIKLGGIEMDNAIQQYIRTEHNVLVAQSTAEEVKIKIGSVWPSKQSRSTEVIGRDLMTGTLRPVQIHENEVRDVLTDGAMAIIEAVRQTLKLAPPELAGDLIDSGIALTGGGAMLYGMTDRLSHELGLPVTRAEEPLMSVVLGLGKSLSDIRLHKRLKWDNRFYTLSQ